VELPESSAWHEVISPSYTETYRGPRSWSGNLLTGKRDQSGLLYMRNRYYDPKTGRFTQEDPIGIAGGLNVYGYANGDPVSYANPYGLRADTIDVQSERAREWIAILSQKSPTFARVYDALNRALASRWISW
jgi:RHS repeat-associated protein